MRVPAAIRPATPAHLAGIATLLVATFAPELDGVERASRLAEDATALLKAALDGVRKHPRQALGINEEATASDAKKAYRKLALKLHPDKTNGATSELFAALTEAHKAVSGEKRRAKAPTPTTYRQTGGKRAAPPA